MMVFDEVRAINQQYSKSVGSRGSGCLQEVPILSHQHVTYDVRYGKAVACAELEPHQPSGFVILACVKFGTDHAQC